MNLEEMQARRKELVEKTRNLRSIADEEKRELAPDEAKDLEEWLARSEHLSTEIVREKRLRALEEDVVQPHQPPTRPDLGSDARPGQPTRFRSFGEQMQAVIRASQPGGYVDPRLTSRAVSGMSEGTPSDGGFLVQTDFATELLKRVYETGQVANRCRRIPVSGNGLKMNRIDETSRADGSRWGGVQAYWTAEGGSKSEKQPHFSQLELNLKKLTGLAYVTDELLEDASALESVLTQAFTEEFGFKLDDAIINGTGAGMPLGILGSPAMVVVGKETGQPADTLQAENVVKMWARCYARSRLNAVWFINQDVEPQLFTMTVPAGTGGGTVYMPPGGLSGAAYGTLFGRPVIPIEQCQTLGDKGDIILADMSQYILIDKGGLQSASSIHVKFTNDETTFRFVYRVDGEPIWSGPLTPFTGAANTLSPFVTLIARA